MKFFDLHCDTITECYLKNKGLKTNDLDISLEKRQTILETVVISRRIDNCFNWAVFGFGSKLGIYRVARGFLVSIENCVAWWLCFS